MTATDADAGDNARIRYMIPGHVIPGHMIRGHVISDHVILDQLIRGHVISGHVIPGHVIPGHVTQLFHVDQRGVVSSLSSIDREVYDAFRFPVVAEDAGTPSRTASEPEPRSTIADGASRSLDGWPADPIPELSDPTGGSAVFLFCVASPSRTGFVPDGGRSDPGIHNLIADCSWNSLIQLAFFRLLLSAVLYFRHGPALLWSSST